jgi:hypothetical protein
MQPTKIDSFDLARQIAEALSRQGISALVLEPFTDAASRS